MSVDSVAWKKKRIQKRRRDNIFFLILSYLHDEENKIRRQKKAPHLKQRISLFAYKVKIHLYLLHSAGAPLSIGISSCPVVVSCKTMSGGLKTKRFLK